MRKASVECWDNCVKKTEGKPELLSQNADIGDEKTASLLFTVVFSYTLSYESFIESLTASCRTRTQYL